MSGRRVRRGTRPLVVGLALAALAAPGAALAAPGAVERAQDSTVRLKHGNLNAVAFAVDGRGGFLTTEQAASRGVDIELLMPDGTTATATRVDSDAPAGLALLRVNGRSAVRPLAFAGAPASVGSQTWTVAPPQRIAGPRRGRVVDPLTPLASSEGVLFIRQPRSWGTTGSPVLNSQGRVVGVIRADRSYVDSTRVQAVTITKRPTALPAFKPPAKSDFPAVPVVLGIFALLLLANILLRIRRRREVAAVANTTRTPSAPERAPAPAPEPLDDLEITLKRPPAEPARQDPPRQDPDENELVTLKRP